MANAAARSAPEDSPIRCIRGRPVSPVTRSLAADRKRHLALADLVIAELGHAGCFPHAGLTSTGVSLKQAPSARSALRSAETSAEIVCPVGLVDSQAPFSLATTPGGTASVTA